MTKSTTEQYPRRMTFAGKSLVRVRNALADAVLWHMNEIGHCPDVSHFAQDLDFHDEEIKQLEKLIVRIDRKLAVCKTP